MSEPDVTLTDYGLTILCAVFALALYRNGDPRRALRGWFVLFFAAAGAAPLFGGTVHGFFPHGADPIGGVLWIATLLAIGVGAFAGTAIGARLWFGSSLTRWITAAAALQLVGYTFLVLAGSRTFRIAVVNYLPAALFLLLALGVCYQRQPERSLALAAIGLVLTFVAAAIQQIGIALHSVYFDHNALYHLVQAFALALIFAGARSLVGVVVSGERLADAT